MAYIQLVGGNNQTTASVVAFYFFFACAARVGRSLWIDTKTYPYIGIRDMTKFKFHSLKKISLYICIPREGVLSCTLLIADA